MDWIKMIILNGLYLSDFFRAKCEDVCNDSPLLQRGPSLHFHQDYVVVQHQIAQIANLEEENIKMKLKSLHFTYYIMLFFLHT